MLCRVGSAPEVCGVRLGRQPPFKEISGRRSISAARGEMKFVFLAAGPAIYRANGPRHPEIWRRLQLGSSSKILNNYPVVSFPYSDEAGGPTRSFQGSGPGFAGFVIFGFRGKRSAKKILPTPKSGIPPLRNARPPPEEELGARSARHPRPSQ